MSAEHEYQNQSYKEIYKSICQQSKLPYFRKGMLAAHFFTRDIGRLCSAWFVKRGIIPNQITVLMIIFGIIGSILFAIPNIWCKIAGYLCWLMWFAMDCSDGQVARYTKNFSKYGTEMDYMAHLIDHPLMNIAIWLTFIQCDIINPLYLSGIFIGLISLELILRNIITFEHYHHTQSPQLKTNQNKISWFRYSIEQVILFPTLIICFSWIFIVGYYYRSVFTFYCFIAWLIIYVLIITRLIVKTVRGFYRG